MPDFALILKATMAAASTAAAIVALSHWGGQRWTSAGTLIGTAVGFYAGCWLLDASFHCSLSEADDRFLLVILPVVVGVELLAIFVNSRQRWIWPLRFALVLFAARALLNDSTFIANKEGVRALWSPAAAWSILGCVAVVSTMTWMSLLALARRTSPACIPSVIALTCIGAAVVIVHSGYATGGMFGLAMAAALAGAIAGSSLHRDTSDPRCLIGIGVIGLYATVGIAYFFGSLSLVNAVVLFVAPLLCWLPEMPSSRRDVSRILVAMIAIAIVCATARVKFLDDSVRTAAPIPRAPSAWPEPTLQDYENFRQK